jgi:hypothetical protein
MNEQDLSKLRSETYNRLASSTENKDKDYFSKMIHIIDSLKRMARDIKEISQIGNSV